MRPPKQRPSTAVTGAHRRTPIRIAALPDRAAEVLECEQRLLHEAEGFVRAAEPVRPAVERLRRAGGRQLRLDGGAGRIVVAAERGDDVVALQHPPDELRAHPAL